MKYDALITNQLFDNIEDRTPTELMDMAQDCLERIGMAWNISDSGARYSLVNRQLRRLDEARSALYYSLGALDAVKD